MNLSEAQRDALLTLANTVSGHDYIPNDVLEELVAMELVRWKSPDEVSLTNTGRRKHRERDGSRLGAVRLDDRIRRSRLVREVSRKSMSRQRRDWTPRGTAIRGRRGGGFPADDAVRMAYSLRLQDLTDVKPHGVNLQLRQCTLQIGNTNISYFRVDEAETLQVREPGQMLQPRVAGVRVIEVQVLQIGQTPQMP